MNPSEKAAAVQVHLPSVQPRWSPLPLAPARRRPGGSAPRREDLSIAGASLGLLAFLAVALIPTLLRGGGASVRVASRLLGAAFAPSMAVNALIVFCVVSASAVLAERAAAIPAAGRS